MAEIRVDGTRLEYLPAGASVEIDPVPFAFNLSDDSLLRQHPRIRRILQRLPSGRTVYLCLHWSDGTNLVVLDRRIALHEVSDECFKGAVVGSAAGVKCGRCGTQYRGLIADTGNPIFVDMGARLRRHQFVLVCDRCGNNLQPHVLEILDAPQ